MKRSLLSPSSLTTLINSCIVYSIPVVLGACRLANCSERRLSVWRGSLYRLSKIRASIRNGSIISKNKLSEVLHCQLHADIPRTFLEVFPEIFFSCNFEKCSIFRNWNSTSIRLAASEPDIAGSGFDRFAKHIRP